MRRLEYLASANRDLSDIARYVTRESGSIAVALALTGRLRKRCRELAALPGLLGQARPELRPELRSTPFKHYLIFFRYEDDAVEIVHVVHGRRDLTTFFGND